MITQKSEPTSSGIKSDDGTVTDTSAVSAGDEKNDLGFERGLYVCGWLKRGPTGIIGTNLIDAEETIESLVEDEKAGTLSPEIEDLSSSSPLARLLESRRHAVVYFPGWIKVDEEERSRGAKEGRIRSKIAEVSEMLQIAGTGSK